MARKPRLFSASRKKRLPKMGSPAVKCLGTPATRNPWISPPAPATRFPTARAVQSLCRKFGPWKSLTSLERQSDKDLSPFHLVIVAVLCCSLQTPGGCFFFSFTFLAGVPCLSLPCVFLRVTCLVVVSLCSCFLRVTFLVHVP